MLSRGGRVAFMIAVAGTLVPALGQVQFKGTPDQPLAISPARDLAGELAVLAGRGGGRVVVQLTAPVTDDVRDALAKSGLTILSPLGGDAFFGRLDAASLDSAAIAASGWVAGAVEIRREWKLHPALQRGDALAWTIVKADDGVSELLGVYVVLHDDVKADAAALDLITKHGGRVRQPLMTVNAIVADMPRAAIPALADEPQVQWVEPALPLLTECNNSNRARVGADTVQAAPYSLNGAGVSVLVFDAGAGLATHVDFQGRLTVIDGSGAAAHATHCSGTIGGAGVANPAYKGMAPGCTLLSAALSAGAGFLYTNPGDIEADYATAWNQGADVASNSIGTNVASNGFDCNWEGDYGVTDGVIDNIVRGSPTVTQGNPFRVVWAGGNERGNGRCGTSFRTIGPPAGAKNHLSIGAINSNDDSMTGFSGWGPTDDGRMKPDFCA